jgi:hypothetical protein
MTKIITHNGRAHLDEYLACAIVAAKLAENGEEFEIIRKSQPTEEELNDPAIWVLDFGKRHEPELKNFDHHQIVGGAVCAFTLVLEYFRMRDYDALPWIKFVEVHDHSGPANAMNLVGGGDFNLIFSPIQGITLKAFSEIDLTRPVGQLWVKSQLLELGQYIIQGYQDYHDTYSKLKEAEIKEINGFRVADYNFIPKNFPLNFNAAKKFEQENGVDIVYTFNDRGASKFRMIRKNEKVDFNQAKDVETVSFVHQSGFLICFDCAPELILDKLHNDKDKT